MLDFTKCFFFIIEIVYAFSFLVCSNSELYIYSNIQWFVTDFEYQNNLYSWDKSHLVITYYSFYIFLV